jgi:hypothetical protein
MTVTDLKKQVHCDGFDPFNDRPSRTVRNTLSEMLRDCLERNEVFGDVPADWLKCYAQSPYCDYIRDRVARYRAATRDIRSLGGSPVNQATILWRHGLAFEAHEILEPHWLGASGDEREGLKGLIQAAGVYVHQEAGHAAAAISLARKAVDRLRRFGEAIGDHQAIGVEKLIGQLERLTETTPPDRKENGASRKMVRHD